MIKYSYLLTLGEFNIDDFDNFCWIFFTFATVTNLIVMLNLLIAIISETFGRVVSD